jgi:hypothetical protein
VNEPFVPWSEAQGFVRQADDLPFAGVGDAQAIGLRLNQKVVPRHGLVLAGRDCHALQAANPEAAKERLVLRLLPPHLRRPGQFGLVDQLLLVVNTQLPLIAHGLPQGSLIASLGRAAANVSRNGDSQLQPRTRIASGPNKSPTRTDLKRNAI